MKILKNGKYFLRNFLICKTPIKLFFFAETIFEPTAPINHLSPNEMDSKFQVRFVIT